MFLVYKLCFVGGVGRNVLAYLNLTLSLDRFDRCIPHIGLKTEFPLDGFSLLGCFDLLLLIFDMLGAIQVCLKTFYVVFAFCSALFLGAFKGTPDFRFVFFFSPFLEESEVPRSSFCFFSPFLEESVVPRSSFCLFSPFLEESEDGSLLFSFVFNPYVILGLGFFLDSDFSPILQLFWWVLLLVC